MDSQCLRPDKYTPKPLIAPAKPTQQLTNSCSNGCGRSILHDRGAVSVAFYDPAVGVDHARRRQLPFQLVETKLAARTLREGRLRTQPTFTR